MAVVSCSVMPARLKLLDYVLCTLSIAMTAFAALLPISTKGAKLYHADGNQFYVRGIVYELSGRAKVNFD